MNARRRALLAGALALLPAARLRAQGFAGLGGAAADFTPVTAPARLAFPRDHGPHPGFRIEWWYLTAVLAEADGTEHGIQWTLFRNALVPETGPGPVAEGWASPQLWLGHAALTGADRHQVAETRARGGIGQAGVTATPFRAFIDDWEIRGLGGAADDALDRIVLRARGDGFGFNLSAEATGPLVAQGVNGYSVKSAGGQASYYYSQPFYQVTGRIDTGTRQAEVTGKGWLDREWSSQPLAADQQGWDWFSLVLDAGPRLMAFRLRDARGGGFVSGSWIAADGTPTPLGPADIRLLPGRTASVAGRRLPVEWRVEVPGRGLAVDTTPLNAQSWMNTSVPYWEGPIRVSGTHAGRGYLEMTGYE